MKEQRLRSKAKKDAEKAAKEAWKKDMASVEARFSAPELGHPKEGAKHRKAFLERVKLLSPELPYALQLRWPSIRDTYAELFPAEWLKRHVSQTAKAVGPAFYQEVNAVIVALGPHFKGVVSDRNCSRVPALSGDAGAFEAYVRRMQASRPWLSSMSMEI